MVGAPQRAIFFNLTQGTDRAHEPDMGVRRYEDLVVWQLSQVLLRRVICISDRLPARRDLDFCQQLRRSTRSIGANIAEGFARYSLAEFVRFLRYADGSLAETETYLHEAHARNFLADRERDELRTLTTRIAANLAKLIAALQHCQAKRDSSKR